MVYIAACKYIEEVAVINTHPSDPYTSDFAAAASLLV